MYFTPFYPSSEPDREAPGDSARMQCEDAQGLTAAARPLRTDAVVECSFFDHYPVGSMSDRFLEIFLRTSSNVGTCVAIVYISS